MKISGVNIAEIQRACVQGMDPALFDSYLGYANGKQDILSTEGGASYITTPNVIQSVAVRRLYS